MKKTTLLLILVFPSLIYFIFELSEANFTRLHMYGPKSITIEGDTIYYTVKPQLFNSNAQSKQDSIQFPVYAIKFLSSAESKQDYHVAQLAEMVRIKPTEFNNINLVIASELIDSQLVKDLNMKHKSITYLQGDKKTFINLYLAGKPFYVDPGFIVLIDKARRIRGYYDGNFADEVRRFVKEYQHLTLRDEQKSLKENTKIERK